eukprot:8634218-Pyramimonas_sp.AAC.1
MPTADTQMPPIAEPAASAGTPATSTRAGLPANEARFRRMERADTPRGRMRGNPLRSRRTDSPVSVRSGASAMSERDVLQTVLMVNTDGQNAVRVDKDIVENIPLTQQYPFRSDEYPVIGPPQQYPVTEEENRAYMSAFTSMTRNEWVVDQRRLTGTYGTAVSTVQ